MKKLFTTLIVIAPLLGLAQTDMDAIMMEKNAFCVGPMYSYSSWKNYWEGTLKRENLNLGTVSAQMIGVMGNYGITRNLNLLFNLPYVETKASAGTLKGMNGIQDLSFYAKWRPVQKKIGYGKLSVFGIAGVSFPASNYVADFLPLSIGLRSTNVSGRLMVDYERGKFFTTASGTYVFRSNIKIDRTGYYTTETHLTNEVEMPNASNFNLRIGYRSFRLIAEAVANQWFTLGGFDITRNNMPFPSNKMNATTVGVNLKYVLPPLPELSLVGGGNTVVAGRNVGQATTVYGAIYYVIDFNRKPKSSDNPTKTN